jgi:ABC-2 type transport system ATP-binding protein
VNAIACTNLSKRYGKRFAVENASFSIAAGEVVGFLGPNGAGKTTTLRMLAGLIRPTSGEGRILGETVPSAALRRVGTMIEEPSFYPYLSGRDNLRYVARLHGGVSDARVDEVLAFVKLELAGSKRVGAYSQGMRQRLGLGRALLWDPEVLLLDEPTNGLDPVGIAEIRESLRSVAARGVTILISSHILGEIEKLVDRILAIEAGRIVFDGPLPQLLHTLDGETVRYRISANDTAALMAALTALSLSYERGKGDALLVSVPRERADTLLRELAAAAVSVREAQREVDDLESAYLRLVRGDGRPS